MAELYADGLTLAYEDTCIIQDLSLSIPHGQITTLVGPNGCGKSTLLRGLSRLLKPKRGSVLLAGQDIWNMPTKQLAKQLGILPQGPVAPEGLTVHELVAQGRYPHQNWLQQWSREDERITREAMDITGIAEFADRAVDTLSGGQRQRAWIAMTLAQDSDLILLDEPTTFLDMAYQIEVLDLLHDLNAERGKTIVMVLHDLNHACRYADHLVAVRGGKVMAQGAPDEVVTEQLVCDVFGVACRIIPDPVTGTPLVVPVGKVSRRTAPTLTVTPARELLAAV
ncbi:MAG: ABC transporter ATP-binding protein [Anaerolineae bacterium]|jgi:iron complex transport system ATP-binding protein|nr:ABC transporter ATP-binding protein [Anaerolineae bacterium]